jgi:hypothetical protein
MNKQIIVYGSPINMRIDEHEPIWAVITPALQQAGVPAPADTSRWRFTDESGNWLDRDKTPSQLGLTSKGMVFLSLEAGIAAAQEGEEG